ncbi:MAG: biotin/lipoyl-binding protein [Lactobacillales bacterium]|jgi:HlyD family secretion protein|nr:biotin/lipoyl-binding protein [Lactobacillales bacterium]
MKKFFAKNKKLVIIISAVVLFVLIVVGVLFFKNKGKNVEDAGYEIYEVKQAEPLTFKGTSIPQNQTSYFLDATQGKIGQVMVKNGQEVKTGEVLYTLQNDEQQEAVETQKSGVNKSSVALEGAQAELNNAVRKRDVAQGNLNKVTQKLNSLSKDSEEYQAQVNELNGQVDLAKQEVDTANDAINQAERAVRSGEIDLSDLQSALERAQEKVTTSVVAKTDGVALVQEITKLDGSTPLVKIVDKEVNVQGEVSEFDYSSLAVGQKVEIARIGSEKKISGEIVSIDRVPTASVGADGGAASTGSSNYHFNVKPAEFIQYGYNVQMSLPVNKLVIPQEAVLEDDKGATVFVYKDGKLERRKIEIEKKDGTVIATKGLKEGEVLIRTADPSFKDGQEIKVSNGDLSGGVSGQKVTTVND